LLNILNDISALSKISNSINYLLRKARDEEITIGIIEYDAEGTSNFTTEEIETLFDILNNPRLDIIVPPIIPRLSCEELAEYNDMLENSGFIKDLSLTDKGYEVAKQLWENFKDKEIIKATSEFLESLDEDELLLYIYVTSPESAEKSDVKEKIMRKRKKIALKMLKEKKISLGLAAKLAGLSYFEMLDEDIKHGIKPFEVKGDI
jgi:predicted HTH domain antitoxin